MASCTVVFTLLCVAVSMLPQSFAEKTTLSNLREFRDLGVAGRIPIPRASLETVLSEYKMEAFGSEDIDISLPKNLTLGGYDEEHYGEVVLADMIVHEWYFDQELDEKVKTTRRVLYITLPVMINGEHGVLKIGEITDSHSSMTSPFSLNRNVMIVESIDDVWDCSGQNVKYKMNDGSVIHFTVEYNAMCFPDEVGEDFNKVIGKTIRVMDLREDFDWGCDDATVAAHHRYCEELEQHLGKIEEAGRNVCLEFGTTDMRRCRAAKMTVNEITGVFADSFEYLAENVSSESSIETEFIDGEHQTGITYPCVE